MERKSTGRRARRRREHNLERREEEHEKIIQTTNTNTQNEMMKMMIQSNGNIKSNDNHETKEVHDKNNNYYYDNDGPSRDVLCKIETALHQRSIHESHHHNIHHYHHHHGNEIKHNNLKDVNSDRDDDNCMQSSTITTTARKEEEEEERIEGNDALGYEYLDHVSDIQIHSWGQSLSMALEQMVLAIFGYMTDLRTIEVNEIVSKGCGTNIVAKGHDVQSCIFSFLDEWLFLFHDTGFVPAIVNIDSLGWDDSHSHRGGGTLECEDNVDDDNEISDDDCNSQRFLVVTSHGFGEYFDPGKHPRGTEVKAITYASMRVVEDNDRCDIWVIVDI